MPIALDPQETVDVSLRIDSEKPEAARPKFSLRFITCREVLRIERLINQAVAAEGNEQASVVLDQILAISLVGWSNVKDRDGKAISFRLDAVDDVLSVGEKWELVYLCSERPRLAEMDKKKSILQRALPTPISAPSAPRANA